MPNTYVNKVELSNGDTLIDITDTTAVADDVAAGKEFYLATGAKAVGTGSMGVQSDWNENDSTSLAYVQNRTHYKTSLGYILPVDLIEYTRYLYAEEMTCEIDGVEHTYNYPSDYYALSLPGQYGEWNFPNGGTDADLDLTVQTAELVVDGVAQNLNLGTIHDGDYTALVYYNSEYLIRYDSGYLWFYANNNTPKQSLVLRLPMANECFEYTQKLDSNYLNGSLIASGTGYKSEIFNGTEGKAAIGDFSHAEGSGEVNYISVALTGDANATEYQFSDNLSYYDSELYYLSDIGTLSDADYNPVNIGFVSISLNGSNGGYIEFTETLDAQNALVGAQYYINLPGTIALGYNSHAEGYSTTASGYQSHAEGYAAIASGDTSHAEGYGTTASGNYSHAEGSTTTASGNYSHTEGSSTTASGDTSHTEGSSTTASGDMSHAEGYGTTASGHYSHAEGSTTTASGPSSHAEGGGLPLGSTGSSYITLTGAANATTYSVSALYINSESVLGILKHIVGLKLNDSTMVTSQVSSSDTGIITSVTLNKTLSSTAITNRTYNIYGYNRADGRNSHVEGTFNYASGAESHAEGLYNTASGMYSHAEGYRNTASGAESHAEGISTIAQRVSNHVFGQYNLPDTGGTGIGTKGNYIEIVGNGTADATRSNARTLDWSGNEVLAGKLTVGAGPVNNMDVATKQYVDTAVSSGGSSDVMIVTVTDTYNEETGERTYSADKTFAEISAHINGGGIAVCDYNGSIYQLQLFVSNGRIEFSFISLDNNDYGTYIDVGVAMEYIIINDDNSIDVFATHYVPMQISTDLSDGQILIFDGEEYAFKNSPIPAQNASIAISNNVITLTNASGQTSSITLPVYSGAVSGGAS